MIQLHHCLYKFSCNLYPVIRCGLFLYTFYNILSLIESFK